MPKASPNAKKPVKSATLQQFSISSFLPSGPSTSASTGGKGAANGTARAKKTAGRDGDDGELVLSDDEPEFKKPAVPTKRGERGTEKARKAAVLDLTAEDDDIQYSASSSPVAGASSSRKKAARPHKGKGKQKDPEPATEPRDDQLWVDRYAPTRKQEELSVHPRKIADVENWFKEALGPNPRLAKYRRVLVLSGPAGAGKTAVVKLLAAEMDTEVIEWKEGQGGRFDADPDRESLVHRFTSFLARAGMAPALDFGPDPSASTSASSSSPRKSFFPPPPPASTKSQARRLILLEDLPNVSHWPTKQALRSAVQQYLASPRVTAPLVIVISEALARPGDEEGGGAGWLSGNGKRGESIDARSVLGVEILNHPACREIAFNPIAATIMRKALNRTLDRIAASPSSSAAPLSRPSIATLDLLIAHSSGDIRSALMSLQFLATEDRGNANEGVTSLGTGAKGQGAGTGKGKKGGKKRKRGEEESEDEGDRNGRGRTGKDRVKQLLQFVTARESSLFIFHALGKVLYNKRWGQSAEDDKKDVGRPGIVQDRKYDRLPKHLRAEWDRTPTKVDPDAVFAGAPLDTDIFLTYLHHNYPPFTNTIEECSRVMDSLGAAESLMSANAEGEEGYRRLPLTSLYGFQIAVRGTLLSLPSPVPRRRQILRKSELWENLRLQRQNEEGVEEILDGETKRAMARLAARGGERDRATLGRGGDGGFGFGELKRTMLCETIPWLGVIKPKEYRNDFLLDLATFPPLDGPEQDLLTGATLGEKDTSLEEMDEGIVVDTAESVRERQGRARRSALQELDDYDDDDGVEEAAGAAADPGTSSARSVVGPDVSALLFDPDDDIDDI
ncbi:RFC checkpoint protein Rad17 [Rhodotorula sphaerocarpa]